MAQRVLVDLYVLIVKLRHRFELIRDADLSPFAMPRPRIVLIRRKADRKIEVRRYQMLRGWRLTLALWGTWWHLRCYAGSALPRCDG